MDDGVMQNQYIGKDMHELRTSIDSMTLRTDSIGNSFGKELINSGYFTLYNNNSIILYFVKAYVSFMLWG